MTAPKNVVLTGGSRGIGLGLTQAFLDMEFHVITTSTNPSSANALLQLKENYPELLEVIEFHADQEDSLNHLAEGIAAVTSNVDLLINNAGVFQDCDFLDLTYQNVNEILKINSIAPLLLTKELELPLKNSPDAKVINISSGMGSIQEFQWPQNISYCMSKTALNMATRAMAEVFRQEEIPVVSVSPGWVRTDMGGSNADISVEESVDSLLKFIESVNMDMTGGFYRRTGEMISW